MRERFFRTGHTSRNPEIESRTQGIRNERWHPKPKANADDDEGDWGMGGLKWGVGGFTWVDGWMGASIRGWKDCNGGMGGDGGIEMEGWGDWNGGWGMGGIEMGGWGDGSMDMGGCGD